MDRDRLGPAWGMRGRPCSIRTSIQACCLSSSMDPPAPVKPSDRRKFRKLDRTGACIGRFGVRSRCDLRVRFA